MSEYEQMVIHFMDDTPAVTFYAEDIISERFIEGVFILDFAASKLVYPLHTIRLVESVKTKPGSYLKSEDY